MKITYLGTPDAAVPPLRALVEAGHQVALVVSRPDAKRGRGGALVPSPVKAAALELGLPVTDRVDDVLDGAVDLGVVVAYGRIIKPHVLDRLAMVNLHFSLLPRWRGAAPVERAVLAGDAETGVCLMAVEEGLDTGGVYAREAVAIEPDESVDTLRTRLVEIGCRLLVDGLAAGLGHAVPQEGEVTNAAKIDPAELHLDWSEPAVHCRRRIQLGRAWTTFQGRRLLVLAAGPGAGGPGAGEPGAGGLGAGGLGAGDGHGAPGTVDELEVMCGDGGRVRLRTVQPEGKGPMAAASWANGARPSGQVLGR